jgi:hypothetical protein
MSVAELFETRSTRNGLRVVSFSHGAPVHAWAVPDRAN